MAKFNKGDRVVAVDALYTLNNGVEGVVNYASFNEVHVTVTFSPEGSDLTVGQSFTFIPASLELKPAGPPLVSIQEVKIGDEIEVKASRNGIKFIHSGVVFQIARDKKVLYTKEQGVLATTLWADMEIRLIKAYEHPLETAVPGTRFSVEYPEWDVSTYEISKYAQGFWLREEFDNQGVLIGLVPIREETARKLYDTKNGKIK